MAFRFCCATLVLIAICVLAPTLSSQLLEGLSRITINQFGAQANDDSSRSVIGPNGAFIAFQSSASNLVPGDSNDAPDIFVKNIETGFIARVSESPSGEVGDAGSFAPFLSATTPKGFAVLVFASDASNLVRPNSPVPDSNGVRDIFFALPGKSRLGRVSIGIGPAPADGPSNDPSVAVVAEPSRMLVVYSSEATNLVADDTNGRRDVYLTTILGAEDDDEPLTNGYTTTLVSRPTDPSVVSDGASTQPQISGDGRFIVFESTATNLVSGFASSERQIYLYEISTGTLTPITRGFDGLPGNGPSRNPSISYSGSFIVFLSRATNLIDDNVTPNGDALQVVRYNVRQGTFDRVNVSVNGVPGDGATGSVMDAQITPDGRLVVFSDTASNLVENDTNGTTDVFVKDMEGGTVTRVSVALDGTEADGPSLLPFLSRAGFSSRTVPIVFASSATNLAEGDTAGNRDIFLNNFIAPRPQLKAGTRIETPPDVTLVEDKAEITTPRFSFPSTTSRLVAAAREPRRIRYQVEAFREGMSGKSADRRRVVTRRNQVTFRNLKSGVYLTRFRVLTLRGQNVVRRTPFSPAQRISEAE